MTVHHSCRPVRSQLPCSSASWRTLHPKNMEYINFSCQNFFYIDYRSPLYQSLNLLNIYVGTMPEQNGCKLTLVHPRVCLHTRAPKEIKITTFCNTKFRVGHAFFSKNARFLCSFKKNAAFFNVLLKLMLHSLHFFNILLKRMLHSLHSFTFIRKVSKR